MAPRSLKSIGNLFADLSSAVDDADRNPSADLSGPSDGTTAPWPLGTEFTNDSGTAAVAADVHVQETDGGSSGRQVMLPDATVGAASPQSSTAHASQPIEVAGGATVEIDGLSAQSVAFTGTTGTLKLDDAADFTGQVSGLRGSDALDLADVRYGAKTTANFVGDATGGTLTVSDGTHTAHVALVGDYLTSGWTLSRDASGGTVVVDPPLSLSDGSANAPAGTPQLPTLLNSYAVRPAWNVAGVDYAVGIPAGTVLKDATTINMAGVVVNAAAHEVHITGNNVTLSGYDFSGGGGWTVYVDSGTNATIENSKFLVGSNHQDPIFVSAPASNVSILNNVIDGAGLLNYQIGQGLIEGDGLGNITIEHNLIKNAYSENIVWGNNTVGATQNISIQYNLIQNAGLGGNQGAHGDWIQLVNSPGANTNSVQINYNTWMQTVPFAQGHTQGLSLYSANSGADSGGVQTEAVQDNTFIVTPGGQAGAYVNYAIIMDTSRLMGTGTITNNYFDPTGIGTPGYGGSWDWVGNYNDANGGPYNGTVTSSNNINLLTGTMIDSTVPAAPVISGDAVNGNLVTLNGRAEGNTTVTVFDGSITLGTSMTNSSGAWTFTTKALAVGSHSFIATATDAAGNTSVASAAFSQSIGGGPSAASPVISSFSPDSGVAGDGITNASTLTLTGTAVANSTVTVFDNGTQIGTAHAGSTGTWDYITAVLTNAKHVLTATDTTSGPSSAASAPLTVTVDTHVPAAPVLVGDPIVNTNQVQLSGTAEASSSITVYDGSNVVGTGSTNSTGNWSVTTNALSSGTHVLTAKATDVAGTASAVSQALDPVIPASPPPPPPPVPAAPKITSFSPDSGVVGDGITNASTLTLKGTAVANSTVKVFDGTTLLGTVTADSTGAWTVTSTKLTDGSHSLTATDTVSGVTSVASSPFSVTVDTHVPAAPVLVGDPIVNTNQVQLSGTAEASSSITVYDGSTVVGTGTTSSAGNWSITTSALSSGTHVLTAKATDVAGTVSAASQALDPVIPGPPPPPPVPAAPKITSFSPDSGVVGDGITNASTLTLKGTAVANSTVKVFDGTTLAGTVTADSTGAWTLTSMKLADGSHSLTATDTVSGVTSAASSPFSVTVDTVAPAAPVLVSDSVVNTNHVLLSGTAEANSTIKVFDGTTVVGTTTAGGNGAWSVTTGALAIGAHKLTATATDVAGTMSAASQPVAPVIGSAPGGTGPSAPKIVSFSDDSGIIGDHITSDNTLLLTGTAVANSTVTVFDGTKQIGTAKADSSGAWNYTTPALTDGSHSLTATATDTDTSGHTGPASSAVAVTIDTHVPAAPTMAIYTPGGTAVGDTTTANDLLLKGTAEANGTVHVFDGGKQVGTATANGSGLWSFDTGHLSDGSHDFTSTAIDAAGNASAASAVKDVTVDGPDSAVGITNMYENSGHIVTIKGTADANSQIKVYDGTKSVGMVHTGADGTWSFTSSSAVSNKEHTFTAQELDSTGHVVASSGSAILGSPSHGNLLTSTEGNDLLVGNGHHDTFVFAPNFGNDVVTDFRAQGRGHDVVQFSKSVFDSFADVLAHATQSGQNVVISDAAGDSLTLKNVKLTALDKHDFHFA